MADVAVASWSTAQKFEQAVRRSFPLLPSHVAARLEAMLTPEALAVVATVVVVWASAHFVGIGEAVDVVLLVAGVAALGAAGVEAAQALGRFAVTVVRAKSEADLDRAGKDFACAVSILGIEVIAALLFRTRPKVFRGPTVRISPPPPSRGRFRYKPQVVKDPKAAAGSGYTTEWGDVVLSSRGSATAQRLAELHERVHQILTPKLYFLRNVRVHLSANGYAKSEILRYLEEALAESAAQIGTLGFRNLAVGLKFPVKEGYVTIAGMATEARAILLGPINVAGVSLRVYFSRAAP